MEGVQLSSTANQRTETPTQEGDAADLVAKCADSVREIMERLSKVASSVSLTNYASKLHDELEERIKKLVKPFKGVDTQNLECLTLMSIETILPDLIIGAALWVKKESQQGLLQDIEKGLRELEKSLRRAESEMKLKEKLLSYAQELANSIDRVKESTVRKSADEESCCGGRDRDTLLKTREFLSQQIDERSHQIWTLGSLFVPVSFLIFAYAMTVYAVLGQGAVFLLPSSTGKVLLMCASLGCYSVWFMFYLRVNRLNKLSYPLIHSLELILGIHGHLSLDQLRLPSRLLRVTWPRFLAALYVLATLWILLFRSSVGISSIAVSMFLSFYVSTWISLKIDILKSIKRIAASILVYATLITVTLLLLPAVISALIPNLDPALL